MNHADRSHSLLSASSAVRWLACTRSPMIEKDLPDTTSESAKEGTLAHELAEAKVKNYFLIDNFTKQKLAAAVRKLKKDPLWQDEMMEHTDTYLDYISAAALRFPREPARDVEKRVYFGAYTHAEMRNPFSPEEGYGTADCVLIGGRVIHIIDFKYGKNPGGRVSAEENPQMMLYALGVYDTYRLLCPVETIRLSIVQPRLADGISEWELPLKDLLEWGEYVKGRALLAWNGEGDFAPSERACRFCRARAVCRARAEKNVQMAFGGDAGKLPPLITNAQMAEYLRQGADLVKWYEELKDAALAQCLAGEEVPGFKAVEGRGSRNWTDMDQAFAALKASGIDEAILYEKKPLTLAQVEKVVGKTLFSETVGAYVKKVPGKPALVESTDNRPAITNQVTAAEAFKEETNYE